MCPTKRKDNRHWEAFIGLYLNRYQPGFGDDRLSTKKMKPLSGQSAQEHGNLNVTLTLDKLL